MPKSAVTTTFRPRDDVLKQLVTARREEVVRLQKSQAAHLADLENRGRARIASLRNALPGGLVRVLDALDKMHDESSAATRSHVDKVKTRLAASVVSPENETAVHPGLAGGHLSAEKPNFASNLTGEAC
jgi:hypothetical protein